MTGKTYVTNVYSTYSDIPAQRRGYDDGPKNTGNQYPVETKSIGRVRSPAAWSTDFVGSPSRIELLNEYVHSPTMLTTQNPNYGLNYENSSPPKYHNEGSWPVKNINFSSPNNYHPSSPVYGSHSEEARSRPGITGSGYISTGNIYGTNKSWQSAGPPTTHHHLTTSTNNIKEALGFLESVNHSTRSDQRQIGVLDELSRRAQPQEAQKRYARPTFMAKPNDGYKKRY